MGDRSRVRVARSTCRTRIGRADAAFRPEDGIQLLFGSTNRQFAPFRRDAAVAPATAKSMNCFNGWGPALRSLCRFGRSRPPFRRSLARQDSTVGCHRASPTSRFPHNTPTVSSLRPLARAAAQAGRQAIIANCFHEIANRFERGTALKNILGEQRIGDMDPHDDSGPKVHPGTTFEFNLARVKRWAQNREKVCFLAPNLLNPRVC